jgi:hypothetical protein
MPENPFDPQERWLNRNEFSVRREITPVTTPRGSHSQPGNLPSVFEDAHPWPLQWGGPEIKQGRFYAHKKFNSGVQKRVENAGARLAQIAKNQGARIRGTVAVTRYIEHNLLERATFKFEAVFKIGNDYKIEPLGEITILQDFTPEQRTAFVKGTAIPSKDVDVLHYQLGTKVVDIDPVKAIKIPPGDVFASLEGKLGDVIHGLKTQTKEGKTATGKQIEKAEKDAIIKADKKAAANTTALPAKSPRATDNKGISDHHVADGRPTQVERATTAVPTASGLPSSSTVQEKLDNFVSRKPPSAEQVKILEASLNKGMTNVTDVGGNRIKVTVKKGSLMAVKASKVANNPVVGVLSLIDDRIPDLDPNSLIQGAVQKYVTAGIQRGLQWLDNDYPPVENLLKAEAKARENYDKAKAELNDQESNWKRFLKLLPPTDKIWQFANKKVTLYLDVLDIYWGLIESRNMRLAATKELAPLPDHIQTYVSILAKLASELEDKAGIALMIPHGYYFGLELFRYSQFVWNLVKQVSALGSAIGFRESEYKGAIEKGITLQREIKALSDKWEGVLATAQEAAGT